jgi:hypothetical protein
MKRPKQAARLSQLDERMLLLRLALTGQIEGEPIAAKTWIFPFDAKSWTDVEPCDWPLAAYLVNR